MLGYLIAAAATAATAAGYQSMAPTGQRFCIVNPQRGPLAGLCDNL